MSPWVLLQEIGLIGLDRHSTHNVVPKLSLFSTQNLHYYVALLCYSFCTKKVPHFSYHLFFFLNIFVIFNGSPYLSFKISFSYRFCDTHRNFFNYKIDIYISYIMKLIIFYFILLWKSGIDQYFEVGESVNGFYSLAKKQWWTLESIAEDCWATSRMK